MPCIQRDRQPQNIYLASTACCLGVDDDNLVLSDVTQAFTSAVDKRQ
jgi:hypothetical protein